MGTCVENKGICLAPFAGIRAIEKFSLASEKRIG